MMWDDDNMFELTEHLYSQMLPRIEFNMKKTIKEDPEIKKLAQVFE